ncbi:DUF420 domain-containing protein [Ectobacillus ponti]|uniref:DUF420 domain-containing protein n=1 Tax=Ectobacillus ponti TaxID=2961894 RepID=A0AA41XCI5_9BACI|nr:DUF420 domain-containing protein [Ectobacillus ponti]MCP8969556.1 DUF420 domain-containing protein [Ectobacillus ponti]
MHEKPTTQRNFTAVIVTLSIVVNALILIVFFGPFGHKGHVGFDITFMPRMNAVFNSFTFVFLLAGLYFIKKGNVTLHKRFVLAAFTTTLLFAITYLTYHYLSAQPTHYGGTGFMRTFYFFILITHSILAAIIVPMALFSLVWGWTNQLTKHRKIVRWTMPLWLYVSFTGVLVYVLLSPYY